MNLSAAAEGPTEDFCASAPMEMLAAIEGNWTLKQGAGGGIGQVIPFPLPPQPPQSVNITIDDKTGLAHMSHDGQEIAFVPIAQDAIADVNVMLGQADADGLIDSNKGCDWYSLPVMLGSNTYVLDPSTEDYRPTKIFVVFRGQYYFLCSNGDFNVWQPPYAGVKDSVGIRTDEDHFCESEEIDTPAPRPGEMVMNLLVKFQGPNSGTGILVFEGSMGNTMFAARAPLTFSR